MAEQQGLTSFVKIIGDMATQQRDQIEGAFTLGRGIRDSIVETDAMRGRLAGNEATFVKNLEDIAKTNLDRQKLALRAPYELEAEPIDAKASLLDTKRALIEAQYGLDAAPTLGEAKINTAKRALSESERLLLASERDRENEERYSTIKRELDKFVTDIGMASEGQYDPDAIAEMPFEYIINAVERSKTSNVSSAAFNEFVLQSDIKALKIYDSFGEEAFSQLVALSPSERRKYLSMLPSENELSSLSDTAIGAIIDTVSRRTDKKFTINKTEPAATPPTPEISSSDPTPPNIQPNNQTPKTDLDTTNATDNTPSQSAKVQGEPNSTGVKVAVDEATLVEGVPPYAPDVTKTQVALVVGEDGSLTSVSGGQRMAFDPATQTVMSKQLMLSPGLRKLVEAEPSETDAGAFYTWAENVSANTNSIYSEVGVDALNGAFNNSSEAARIKSAKLTMDEFKNMTASKEMVTSSNEMVTKLSEARKNYADRHPFLALFMGGPSIAPPLDFMLSDPKMVNTIINMVDPVSKTQLVKKSELERHLLGVEKLSAAKKDLIKRVLSGILQNPSEFYNMTILGINDPSIQPIANDIFQNSGVLNKQDRD